MKSIALLSQQLAELLPTLGTDGFAERLIVMLKTLVPVSDATVIVYPQGQLPHLDYSEPRDDGSSLKLFCNGAFLLDPFYRAAHVDGRRGFLQMSELVPQGFEESEYYNNWYGDCGWQDECGYLVSTGPNSFINISLGRLPESEPFEPQQVSLLADLTPLIEQLCREHWEHHPQESTSEPDLRAQLQLALDGFGSSVLTDRETQVINLVLRGHNTRIIAEKLSISIETVKLHRKHAYAKLEIGSQTELFYLFLDSLMSASDFAGGDTLEAYMRPVNRPAS